MATEATLAFDLGTTNWKAGLFMPGQPPLVRSCPVVMTRDVRGNAVYSPDDLWHAVCELTAGFPQELLTRVTHVGVSGMAEAGLLLRRGSGEPLSPVLPWSDPRGLAHMARVPDRFMQTGLPKHSKYSLFKLLALAEETDLRSSWWLGVPEYVAWRISGVRATDPTLAARTYAYDAARSCWDVALLRSLGMEEELFAPVFPTGASIGTARALPGVPSKATVSICGHDHLAAAYALDGLGEDKLFLSAGTAQVILRWSDASPFREQEHASGLSYGPSPTGEGWVCLGSLQSAGGSVNRWRAWLGLSVEDWWLAAKDAPREVSPLLYLPYLAGSGAPHLDPTATGALLGLRQNDTHTEIVRGVLQGIGWETRWVMERMGKNVSEVVAAGGLSRQPAYMQTLANALGRPMRCPGCLEATLEGAAMLAAGAHWEAAGETQHYLPQERSDAWERQYRRYCRAADRLLKWQKEDDDHDDL